MSFETPVTLAELRTALIERCQLDTNDPMAVPPVLDRNINAAVCRFSIADPHGWPWDFQEVGNVLPAGASTVVFDGSNPVPTKIRYVALQNTSVLWEYPLERVTRFDQLERYPNDSERGAPRTYSLVGREATGGAPGLVIAFRPVPDIDYQLVIGMQLPLDELVNDTDPDPEADHEFDAWSSSVLAFAAYLTYRMRSDLPEAVTGALAEFDSGVLVQRRTARSTFGPGLGMRPLADDRELQ